MIKQNKGFTLIELFVALVILAAGLFALTQMGVTTIGANQDSSADSIATRLAQNKIDELKKDTYGSLALQNFSDPQNPLNSQGTNGDGGIYTRTWTVTSGPTTGTKKVTVRVTWESGAKAVTLKSLVADEGH
ncbi:MAG: prepilin-type N-terminal cleavage/methylation domain-containing protein [Deltaproteobacteria bacterium]|nr:prepilin-type N-terminal cleavage/methylation domain-containing protein [Deltaproteobacteria bacterium]